MLPGAYVFRMRSLRMANSLTSRNMFSAPPARTLMLYHYSVASPPKSRNRLSSLPISAPSPSPPLPGTCQARVSNHPSVSVLGLSTGPPQHHAARDHVMQRLLSLREARHDVADEHGNHVRYDLAEVPPRCARKADALPNHIGNDQAQRFLPHSSLPLRAFHQSMVEPGHDQAHGRGKKNKTDDQEKPGIPQLFLRMNLAQESAQSGQKDQRNQNQHHTETNDDIVDDVRQQSQPKSSVLHALNRGIRRSRSRHAHHRRPRCSNHQKRLPAVWAKRRPFRQRRATFGTVHGVSLVLPTSHENAKTCKNAGQILLSSRHAVNHDPCRSLSPRLSGTRHFICMLL